MTGKGSVWETPWAQASMVHGQGVEPHRHEFGRAGLRAPPPTGFERAVQVGIGIAVVGCLLTLLLPTHAREMEAATVS